METKLSKAKRSSLSNDVPPILAESEDCTPDQELENKMSSLDIKDEIASNDDVCKPSIIYIAFLY